MAVLRDLVIDCARPSAVARFWADVLDGYRVAAYDEAEVQRLAALGVHHIDDDPSVLVEPVNGTGPRLFFQHVPEPKRGKNSLHLDLRSADATTEFERLKALGATVLAFRDGHVVLADVEGNEFCLMR